MVTRHVKIDGSGIKSALPDIAKAFSHYSDRTIFSDPKIKVDDEDYFFFTEEHAVGTFNEIAEAEIEKIVDDGNVPIYVLTGRSHYNDAKDWLCNQHFDLKTDENINDFMVKNERFITEFLKREYKADVDWSDDWEFRLVWECESVDGYSVSDAWDEWEKTSASRFFNESDPGTFGSRNMWAALANAIKARDEVADSNFEDIVLLSKSPNIDILRAVSKDVHASFGKYGHVIRENLVNNKSTPSDVLANVFFNARVESSMLAVVNHPNLTEEDLGMMRGADISDSVRDAIDARFAKNVMNGFGGESI